MCAFIPKEGLEPVCSGAGGIKELISQEQHSAINFGLRRDGDANVLAGQH